MILILESPINHIKSFLGIKSGSMAEMLIDTSANFAPYVSSLYNAYKMNRFKKRIAANEEAINRIGEKFNKLDDEELKFFIQSTVFPYVLDDLIEENQDRKIEYILNGFEFIIDEQMNDEGFALACFDVLRELRVDDIIRLLKFTDEYRTKFAWKIEEDSFKNMVGRWSKEEVEKFQKEEIFSKQIDNKLLSKNLIDNEKDDMISRVLREFKRSNRSGGNFDSLEFNIRNEVKRVQEYHLTQFGKEFIRVFDLRIADNVEIEE